MHDLADALVVVVGGQRFVDGDFESPVDGMGLLHLAFLTVLAEVVSLLASADAVGPAEPFAEGEAEIEVVVSHVRGIILQHEAAFPLGVDVVIEEGVAEYLRFPFFLDWGFGQREGVEDLRQAVALLLRKGGASSSLSLQTGG